VAGGNNSSRSGSASDDEMDVDQEADGWADWIARTRLQLDIYDTHIVVPDQPGARHLADTSIDWSISHMTASTRPAWNAVPKLDTAVALLRRSDILDAMRADVGQASSNRVCFQWKVEGVRCVLQRHHLTDATITPTPVLEPATIVLYGRFCRRTPSRRARLEALLECSNLNVTVTARQYEYFLFASSIYARWSQGLVTRHAGATPSTPRRSQAPPPLKHTVSSGVLPDRSPGAPAHMLHAPASERPNSPQLNRSSPSVLRPPAALQRKPSIADGLSRRSSRFMARYALGLDVDEPPADESVDLSKSMTAATAAAAAAAASPRADDHSAPKRHLSMSLARENVAIRVTCAILVEHSVFNVPLNWEHEGDTSASVRPSKVAFSLMQMVADANGEEREMLVRLAGAEALGNQQCHSQQ
jgi:hypothetical protein